MTEDEKFEMTWAELLRIVSDRDKKTVEAVDIFISLIRCAVEAHPQGELHDFLASKTAVYAAMLTSGDVINLGDLRAFFRACGFDLEMIEGMLITFELAFKIDKKLDEIGAGKIVE